jgi:putative zinc finger protein
MKHLTERQLTSVFEDTLPAEQEERILLHLARCEACERRTQPAMGSCRQRRRAQSGQSL